jgi:hypothetical protein
MTLESYDKQHVGREEDFRCALHRGLLSGQTSLMQVRLLLPQHFFKSAATHILHRSQFHQSGHSLHNTLTIQP